MRKFVFVWLFIKFINYYICKGCSFYFNGSIMGMYSIELWFYQNDLDTTTLKKSPVLTRDITIEETIMCVVSTGTIAWFVLVRPNSKILWKDYLRLDVWCYDNFLIYGGFILCRIKRKEAFDCIVVVVVKIYVSTSLDKNNKHSTSVMCSKIDYININNNIDKNKNARTCIS